MIAFLVAAIVVLAAAAVVAVVIVADQAGDRLDGTANRILTEFSKAEEIHRLERAAIMRAIVARNGSELVMLDRTAGQAEQARHGKVGGDDSRRVSEQEFRAMIQADMEAGLGGEPAFVPPVPEGF